MRHLVPGVTGLHRTEGALHTVSQEFRQLFFIDRAYIYHEFWGNGDIYTHLILLTLSQKRVRYLLKGWSICSPKYRQEYNEISLLRKVWLSDMCIRWGWMDGWMDANEPWSAAMDIHTFYSEETPKWTSTKLGTLNHWPIGVIKRFPRIFLGVKWSGKIWDHFKSMI